MRKQQEMKMMLLLIASMMMMSVNAFFSCSIEDIAHRSIDGRCNNLLRTELGAAGTYFAVGSEGTERYPWQDVPQVSPLPTYANASTLPPSGPRPRARIISNALGVRANPEQEDPINHSLFSTAFGQFINHDIEHNRFNNASQRIFPLVTYMDDPTDPLCQAVAFPPSPYRCNAHNTMLTMEARSSGGVYDSQGNFKVYNNATSYFDLSTVYGPTEHENAKLRTNTGGKLIMAAQNTITLAVSGVQRTFTFEDILPSYNQTFMDVNPSLLTLPFSYIFTAGDGRVNENIALTLMHLVFAREHNLLCDELMAANPLWAAKPDLFDDAIFRKARALNIAKYQHIVYEQYFPSEFSEFFANQLGPYLFYRPTVDPSTSSLFASAAFRYGHYSLKQWRPINECGNSTIYNQPSTAYITALGQTAPAPLMFAPLATLATAGSFANIARGLISGRTSSLSTAVDDQIRNIRVPTGGVDLITLDIQRARQNQVPNYQKIRMAHHGKDSNTNRLYGLPGCPRSLENNANIEDPIECFVAITGNATVAATLKSLYKKVNNIDAVIGLVAEQHVLGTSFGRTIGNIITDQYKKKRDGDRFFYRNLFRSGYFNLNERQTILSTTMGKILERNLPGMVSPANPFVSPSSYRKDLFDTCPQNN